MIDPNLLAVLASLLIGVGTIVVSNRGLKQKAGNDFVNVLNTRLTAVEAANRACEEDRKQLGDKIIALNERMLEAQGKVAAMIVKQMELEAENGRLNRAATAAQSCPLAAEGKCPIAGK